MMLQRLAHSEYAKSVGTLVSGSLIAQMLVVLVAPIMTRLYSPSAIGAYTLIISVTSIFGAVLSLRYDLAIVYDQNDDDVPPLVALSSILVLSLSLIIAMLSFIYFSFFPIEGLSAILACLFVFVLCVLLGIVNILNSCNNRMKDYRVINSANIERSVVQNGGIVTAGIFQAESFGLVFAQVFGYLAGMLRQMRPLGKLLLQLRFVKKKDIRRAASVHKKQAVWSAPAVLLNGVSFTAINYLIDLLYSIADVGFYSLSYRVLGLPITIVGINVSRVFTERAAREREDKGSFKTIFKKTFILIVFVSIPVGAMLIVFSPAMFAFLFGQEWRIAGVYVQILTPMYLLRLISGCLNGSTIIAGKQHLDIIVQAFLLISVCASFIFALLMKLELVILLGLISTTSSVVYIVYICIFWYSSRCFSE